MCAVPPCAVPGRREDQREDAEGVLGQVLEDGQCEGRGLAAAGVRRADDVPAGQDGGYAAPLHLSASATSAVVCAAVKRSVLCVGASRVWLKQCCAGTALPLVPLGSRCSNVGKLFGIRCRPAQHT